MKTKFIILGGIVVIFAILSYLFPIIFSITYKIAIILLFIGINLIDLILGKKRIEGIINNIIPIDSDYFDPGNIDGFKYIKQAKWQGFVQILNKKIKLGTSLLYGVMAVLFALLFIGIINHMNIWFAILFGIIIFLINFFIPEKKEEFEVPAGSKGLIYIRGALLENVYTSDGLFEMILPMPIIGKNIMKMGSQNIDPLHHKMTVKEATTSGDGKKKGVPLDIPLLIEMIPVNIVSVHEVAQGNEDAAKKHIEGVFDQIVGEVTDSLTFDEIFGPNGTKKYYEALLERIEEYKKKNIYFYTEVFKPIDERLDFMEMQAVDKKIGYGIKVLIKPIMPSKQELGDSLSLVKETELEMESKDLKSNKLMKFIDRMEKKLKKMESFKNASSTEIRIFIAKTLDLDDQNNKTEEIIHNFGLTGNELKEVIKDIFKEYLNFKKNK